MVIPDKGRLFSTGCSYSSFVWPTYVDFLSSDFKETISVGKTGAGNDYIFNSAIQMIQEHKPNSNDLVLVQWSGVTRVDKIFNNSDGYHSVGQLGNQEQFEDEWVDKYFNLVQHAFNLYNYILSVYYTAKYFNTNIVFLNMFDPWVEDMYGEPYSVHHLFKKYNGYIKKHYPFKKLKNLCSNLNFLQSLEEFSWSVQEDNPHFIWNTIKNKLQEDRHPSPLAHHAYAKHISETLNLNCRNIFKKEISDYQRSISSIFQDSTLTPKKASFKYDLLEKTHTYVAIDKQKGPASLFGKKYVQKHHSINSKLETKIYNK